MIALSSPPLIWLLLQSLRFILTLRRVLALDLILAWTSLKIKMLGVFVGFGNLDEANWHLHIEAVKCCLNSWRSRSLSFSGKVLNVNALSLARIWYVASLVPMPPWVLSKLNKIVFNLFWSRKRDLVT